GRRLIAFYVRNESVAGDPDDFRDFLRTRLADYMVPSHFVPLDGLPRLPNGKLDRRSLRLPQGVDLRRDIVEPRDAVEKTLADIWTNTLGLKAVSVMDDFFEIGGDSLLTFHISVMARDAGYALVPRDLYEHRTLEALARHARTAREMVVDSTV